MFSSIPSIKTNKQTKKVCEWVMSKGGEVERTQLFVTEKP